MLTEEKIKELLKALKEDERLSYNPANVFSNAPLALIQASRMAEVNVIEKILELPLSTLPIKNKPKQI